MHEELTFGNGALSGHETFTGEDILPTRRSRLRKLEARFLPRSPAHWRSGRWGKLDDKARHRYDGPMIPELPRIGHYVLGLRAGDRQGSVCAALEKVAVSAAEVQRFVGR